MILIKNGYLVDPLSGKEGNFDILIEGEKVIQIDKNIDKKSNTKLIDASNCIVSPGFIDIHSHFRDPGFTYKEDIFTGAEAAAAGGYTTVICMANTKPVVDNVDVLTYILNKAKSAKIEVLQVASITKNMSGKELVDMPVLKNSGAIGFSDDGKPLMNSNLVFNSMKMAKKLEVPLSFHEEDPNLIYQNGINSGIISEKLHIKGATSEAENVLVARDICLAISTGAKINIQHISSALSVALLKWAKKMGGKVTAEATPHHFSMTENMIIKKGTNAKINPPLRTENDRLSIIKALKDNTIEIIATDHAPHSSIEKIRKFSLAPSGIIGLETALPICITNLIKPGFLTYMNMISKLTINPARLYNLDRGYIKIGHIADITVFNPNEKYRVNSFASKSCNSPFLGQILTGRVKFTIHRGKIVYKS